MDRSDGGLGKLPPEQRRTVLVLLGLAFLMGILVGGADKDPS